MSSIVSWLLGGNRPFVKKGKETLVLNHKYVGNNDSIFYHYVLNSLCTAIVERIPTNIAPNLITLMALMVNVLPCLHLYVVYGPKYEGEISAEMSYVIGISYMIYIVLDNCDGK
mmetsp:Transcript_6127/g.10407  ORF Transcript_6127/g.10407 Transcript_6127/m.10407 type:complete len:114 (-) Transcript_6127:1056-1397(-)